MTGARLIGYAGSGKTTELLAIMERALPHLGNDPRRLGFASMTRAARATAVERAAKAWSVPPATLDKEGWFRTVHSTCLRCLESEDKLIGSSKADQEWLSEALGVRLRTEIDEDYGTQRVIGDPVAATAINCWALARVTLRPLGEVVRAMRAIDDDVPDLALVVRMTQQYETKKRIDNRLDYTDLLARFAGWRFDPTDDPRRCEPQGYLPDVAAWLFDEQQDASPLLDAVCKRLVSAPGVKWFYVVGDPFQSIYGFAGATSDCFLGWDVAKERTMAKSWRCPKQIMELGEKCLRRMSRGYFPRNVAPADHEGEVVERGEIGDLIRMIKPDEDWLLLGRSNFHADRLYAACNAASIPVRKVKSPEGANKRAVGMTALYRLERNEPVSGEAWGRAIELLPVSTSNGEKILTRGTKTKWAKENSDHWDWIFRDDLKQVGATPALIERIRSGKWCELPDYGQEWRTKAERHGVELTCNPRVRTGTIHSVKGDEADNVALLTTVGKRVEIGREDPRQGDEEHRLAYVAVTRAKRRFVVVNEGRVGRIVPRMEVL